VKGDADAAFRDAPYVRRERFVVQRHTAVPMESRGFLAEWESDRLTLYGAAKVPFPNRRILAKQLGLAENAIRMVENDVGGGFGVRGEFYPEDFLIPFAARLVGRPVKWIEDRVEHLAASSAATGRATHIDGAFDGDGRLLALRLKQTENVGAYLRPPDPASLYRMHSTLSGPYRVRHIAVENKVVVTNQVPSGLNRGFGGPQFYYPLERMMDLAAKEIGIDPVELRLRNVVQTFPYETPAGSLLESGNYRRCIELALERAGYRELMAQRESARKEGRSQSRA